MFGYKQEEQGASLRWGAEGDRTRCVGYEGVKYPTAVAKGRRVEWLWFLVERFHLER
jgi:hypothetical protein